MKKPLGGKHNPVVEQPENFAEVFVHAQRESDPQSKQWHDILPGQRSCLCKNEPRCTDSDSCDDEK